MLSTRLRKVNKLFSPEMGGRGNVACACRTEGGQSTISPAEAGGHENGDPLLRGMTSERAALGREL